MVVVTREHHGPSRPTRVLFALAHFGPLTASEIRELWGESDDNQTNTSWGQTCRTLWKQQLLVRRKRETDDVGMSPFEYDLRPMGDDHDWWLEVEVESD